jgi:hypothetical protein
MATTWTVQTDLGSSEADDWTIDDLGTQNTKTERNAWALSTVSPNASGRDRALGWGNWAVEEFHFLPEEVDAVPEQLQADRNQWTVRGEAK